MIYLIVLFRCLSPSLCVSHSLPPADQGRVHRRPHADGRQARRRPVHHAVHARARRGHQRQRARVPAVRVVAGGGRERAAEGAGDAAGDGPGRGALRTGVSGYYGCCCY